jgi:AcrR family transcriptional regulator
VTKGALYHHFPDKKALGIAVIDEVIAPRLHQMFIQPVEDADNPLDGLLAAGTARVRAMDAEAVSLGCPFNNLMQEMSPVDADFRTHLTAILDRWRNGVAGALKRGQERGLVRASVDARATALFIVSAIEGCIGIAKTLQSPRALRECTGEIARYVESLRAPPRSERRK